MEIAEQTGGRMYSPHKIGELSSVYSEIADDLRIQYQLGYNSTNRAHDGQWRKIRVAVSNHPEAVVRTRKGYYARKDREYKSGLFRHATGFSGGRGCRAPSDCRKLP